MTTSIRPTALIVAAQNWKHAHDQYKEACAAIVASRTCEPHAPCPAEELLQTFETARAAALDAEDKLAAVVEILSQRDDGPEPAEFATLVEATQ